MGVERVKLSHLKQWEGCGESKTEPLKAVGGGWGVKLCCLKQWGVGRVKLSHLKQS